MPLFSFSSIPKIINANALKEFIDNPENAVPVQKRRIKCEFVCYYVITIVLFVALYYNFDFDDFSLIIKIYTNSI